MSKNSKVARKLRTKQSFKRAEMVGKNAESTGSKGPAKTQPVHGKTKAWYQVGKSNNPKAKQSTKKDKNEGREE